MQPAGLLPSGWKRSPEEEITLKAIARRHPFVAFTVLTYLISWTGWGGLILKARLTPGFEPMKSLIVVLIAATGPTAAGLALAGLTGGKSALKEIGARIVRWRVGLQWYVLALSSTAILLGCVALLYRSLGWTIPAYSTTLAAARMPGLSPSLVPLIIFVPYLLGGPLNEELGWRGFALPELLSRHSRLTASLMLGLVWAVWHLPLFFMPGTGKTLTAFPAYGLSVIGLTFLFTLLHVKSGGSLLLAILFHNAVNVTAEVTPLTTTGWPFIAVIAIAGCVMVMAEPRGWLEPANQPSARIARAS